MKTIASKLLLGLLCLSSCSPVLYSNVGQNIPLLQEQGEFSGQIAYATAGPNDGVNGVSLQGAYSISNHWAVLTSFYSMGDNYKEGWKGKGTYIELGGGYFTKMSTSKIVFEVFGGVGFGSIKNQDNSSSQFVDVSYSKPFVQPSLGFTSKYFEVAVTPRIGKIDYQNTSHFISDLQYVDELASYLNKFDGNVCFEPGIMVRGGFQNVMLQVQYVYSNYAKDNWSRPDYLSFGLRFLISERSGSKLNP
jgi:hypothetical protein